MQVQLVPVQLGAIHVMVKDIGYRVITYALKLHVLQPSKCHRTASFSKAAQVIAD